MPRLTPRMLLIVCHDVVVTAIALLASLYVCLPEGTLAARLPILTTLVPAFCLYAAVVYMAMGLYRPKWRFTSMPDLIEIAKASTVLALTLLVTDYVLVAPNAFGEFVLGKKTIAIYWVLQIFFLGATRIAYRHFRHGRTHVRSTRNAAVAALGIGRSADVEVLLRAIESGAVQRLRVAAILSPSDADQQQSVRGVRVTGRPGDLEEVVRRFEVSRNADPAHRLHRDCARARRQAGSPPHRRAAPWYSDKPPALA